MALSEAERRLRARLGAYVQHSLYDPVETTRVARAGFMARFEREVDPEGRLPEAERLRRALAARRAYMTRLALRSAVARSRKNGRR